MLLGKITNTLNKMRTLAKAHPSKHYRWYKSIASIVLEARLSNNNIYYYEIDTNPGNGLVFKERRISEQDVRNMFRTDKVIKKQPFLVNENKDFYSILNQHRIRYQERFRQIKSIKPKIQEK